LIDVRIILSSLWVATILAYLLGDVLRIFSGDMVPGEMQGMFVSQSMWLGIAVLMVIPIIMMAVSLTLNILVNGWANIIVAIF
jgi:hypothetical protein